MNKQTVLAADFSKKTYAKPSIKAHQVTPTNIICTSPSSKTTTASKNEEYEEDDTSSWF